MIKQVFWSEEDTAVPLSLDDAEEFCYFFQSQHYFLNVEALKHDKIHLFLKIPLVWSSILGPISATRLQIAYVTK